MKPKLLCYFTFVVAGFIAFLSACKQQNTVTTSPYLNHNDSAQYVGINACKQCHRDIYDTFIETGMGQSFDLASRAKSSAKFSQHTPLFDQYLQLYYKPYLLNDKLYIKEFRLVNGDTTYQRTELVTYIIGSGQHTNSHLMERNGYIYQMPLTFYTQESKWDFPPGFEKGRNSRFSRKIELECMSCHNAYPNFETQSLNKFNEVLTGIDCERCHGPGSIHVSLKQKGIIIDTTKLIDYSIVNPKKLPYSLQVDICQRCHLQGNAVLNDGKSFFDFKPGQKLSNTLSIFMPQYTDDESFIMASHAERMKLSNCFLKSIDKKLKIEEKSYENQVLKDELNITPLSCIHCHNPHKSVKITEKEQFNTACLSCHYTPASLLSNCTEANITNTSNCVSCHMPKSGAIDIPHVSITDHKIQLPIKKSNSDKIRTFVRLKAINNPNPTLSLKAKAYLNYYEKFESAEIYLDSARYFILQLEENNVKWNLEIQAEFLANNYSKVIENAEKHALKYEDPWTNYRIAESYLQCKNPSKALAYINNALQNYTYILDFQFKKAIILQELNLSDQAKKTYQFILKENPDYELAHYNLGYIYLESNDIENAKKEFLRTYQLNPNYLDALFGLAGIEAMQENKQQSRKYLNEILALNPNNTRAQQLLESL